LVNCSVLDVGDGSIRDVDVLVADGRIQELASAQRSRRGGLDLGGLTLLPGLMSCHAHFSQAYPFSASDPNESPAVTVLRAAKRAKDALLAGVTTVRCVGEQHAVDIALRTAWGLGLIEAPRILAATRAISVTGGHGTVAGSKTAFADGPDEFLRTARSQLALGADHLKIFITGGIGGVEERTAAPQMTDAEISAVVQAAREHGTYVTAHASTSAAIANALKLGVRSFEHGYEIDDPTAQAMADAGAYLTPTLCVTRTAEWMGANGFTPAQVAKAIGFGSTHLASARRAVSAGVSLVNGTDDPPGSPIDGTSLAVREMEFMTEAGLSNLEVIRSATMVPARMCGISDQLGQLQPGYEADIIGVLGNPLENLGAMRAIRFVMLAGDTVRSEPPSR
jgi:imidazolonepropionase-like amidohydrolase